MAHKVTSRKTIHTKPILLQNGCHIAMGHCSEFGTCVQWMPFRAKKAMVAGRVICSCITHLAFWTGQIIPRMLELAGPGNPKYLGSGEQWWCPGSAFATRMRLSYPASTQ